MPTHPINLIDLASAGEERFPGHQLCKDTSDRPHVHRRRVLLRTEQQLRRPRFVPCQADSGDTGEREGGRDAPVPEGDDELSHLAEWITKLPGETEIGDLDLAAVIHEQVGGLQIAVQLGSSAATHM